MKDEKIHPLKEIWAGYKNLIVTDPVIEKIAMDRYDHCHTCEKLRSNRTCSICGCFMPAKVRSPKSKCPPSVGKWGAVSDEGLRQLRIQEKSKKI